MEKFNNRTTRGLSYLLIYLTAIQPLHPAFAALTPDSPKTQVNNAGAVPVINIATPNAAGVSHNTYKDFSVGTPGTVLNNSTVAGKSQLAGQVNANANLKGKAADLIINEVTGSTRSDLQGKIEVFGNKANVLIANPNGITCDGCGFINTPSATLTTGKPVLDQQGALEALEVKKGSITIGGKGLDGSATDYVDILSRATELNGKINAKNLTLTQGSNRVDFKAGTIAPIAGEGAKPLLAVDTKALGGMYAERIRLVATEDGVGANVANLTSSQQGITLDSKGKIQLGNVHAKTDINLTAQQVDIAAGNTVKSDRDITLASTVLNNQGNIIAGEDMRLFNDNLTNTQATIQANNNLWIQKDATGNKGVKVENRSGTIKTNTGDLVIRTRSLNNVRDQIVVKEKKDLTYANLNVGNELPIRSLSDAKTYIPLIVKKELEGDVATSESEIHGAKNLYINATRLENNASNLKSYGNIFLAGQEFLNISPLLKQTEHTTNFRSETAQEQAIRRSNTPQPASTTILDDGIPLILAYYKVKDKESVFKGEQLLSAKVHATGNVVADFERLIKIGNVLQPTSPTVVTPDTININGNEVLLNAGDIKINGIIESSNNINLISKNQTIIDNSNLLSKNKDININSIATIASTISVLKANNVSLNSREGNIYYSTGTRPTFNDNGDRQYASLHAGDTLSLNSGGNINLSGVIFGDNTNTALTAKKDIIINNHQYDLITHKTGTGVTQGKIMNI
ncbi:filamentous hemagglutinin N-terminal domain-containing protein, partial [Pectobacterium aquaticum]|uniref:filamentous hemagglutinin N-terminal domain-containing protein n=1 Tax=Pectobacterium aquaticum TaxID=2204145 RepID=UPI001F0E0883